MYNEQEQYSFEEDQQIYHQKDLKVNRQLIDKFQKKALQRNQINQKLLEKEQAVKIQTFKNMKHKSLKQQKIQKRKREKQQKRRQKKIQQIKKRREKMEIKEEIYRIKQMKKQKPQWIQASQRKPKKSSLLKKIKTIDENIAKNLIDYFNLETVFPSQTIALRLGISTGRVQKARKQYQQTGKINLTVSNEITKTPKPNHAGQQFKARGILLNLIKENPIRKLADMRQILLQKQIDFSTYKIGDLLHLEGYQCRKLGQPLNYNSEQILKKRFQFAKRIENIKKQNLYYLSQTKFNLTIHQRYGWVKKDQEYKQPLPVNSTCWNVLILVGFRGLLKYVILNPIDGWQALNLKKDIVDVLQRLGEQDKLIVQNPISKEARNVIYSVKKKQFSVLEISQCSYQLNPAKTIFSSIKTKFVKMRQKKQLKNMQHMRQKLTILFEGAIKQQNGPITYQKMRYFLDMALKKINFDQFL